MLRIQGLFHELLSPLYVPSTNNFKEESAVMVSLKASASGFAPS